MKKFLLMIMLMAPLATFAQKFGKVNSQTIFSSLPEVAKANGEFQALQQQKRNELEACRMSSSASSTPTRRARAL